MSVYFISDLHLYEETQVNFRLFEHFVEEYAPSADSIYLLGDIFSVWIGEDAAPPCFDRWQELVQRQQARHGTRWFFLPGNRDFLISKETLERVGVAFLPDPFVLSWGDTRYLLTHGDQLCRYDTSYQWYRSIVRNPVVKRFFLAWPVSLRTGLAQRLQSGQHAMSSDRVALSVGKRIEIEERWYEDLLRTASAQHLIHGHTHRPDCRVSKQRLYRWVLGEWTDEAMILKLESPQRGLEWVQLSQPK